MNNSQETMFVIAALVRLFLWNLFVYKSFLPTNSPDISVHRIDPSLQQIFDQIV